MPNACVLLTDGFEEIEAVTIIDVFRRAGIETTVVGVGSVQPRGAHGLAVVADVALDAAKDETWDLVVLPGGMTGARVAARARQLHPALKVLFTTGYARNAIFHHGRLDKGIQLLTKPFSFTELAGKVRDVLDGFPR